MDNSTRGHIPMQERLDLNKTQGASTPKEVKHMQNVPYASVVGSNMYDLKYLKICSWFSGNPEVDLELIAIVMLDLRPNIADMKSPERIYVFMCEQKKKKRSRLEKLQVKYYCKACYIS
ncbi:hypothetical protein Tco_1418955 [Tanacetum coccineum]